MKRVSLPVSPTSLHTQLLSVFSFRLWPPLPMEFAKRPMLAVRPMPSVSADSLWRPSMPLLSLAFNAASETQLHCLFSTRIDNNKNAFWIKIVLFQNVNCSLHGHMNSIRAWCENRPGPMYSNQFVYDPQHTAWLWRPSVSAIINSPDTLLSAAAAVLAWC